MPLHKRPRPDGVEVHIVFPAAEIEDVCDRLVAGTRYNPKLLRINDLLADIYRSNVLVQPDVSEHFLRRI